jgi:hypothetical protein
MIRRASGFLILLFITLFLLPARAFAQEESSDINVYLSTPDTANFPEVSTFLKPFDKNGNFIHGLKADNLVIFEDELPITDLVLEENRPGAQAVIVILPGPTFALRNAQAVSRFDVLLETLKGWATSKTGSDLDDLSLIIAEGGRVIHTSDTKDLLSALETPVENLRQAVPNLDLAFQAVEIAADASPRPGMGKAVFLVTPPLDNSYAQSLENLAARAREQNVQLNVWMVGPDDPSTQAAIERLRSLARTTSGQFGIFSEATDWPIEIFLENLRESYRVSYSSLVRSSGTHQVFAEVQAEPGTALSNVQSFEINLQPPVAAFILPPLEILREPSINDEQNPMEIPITEYTPKFQELQIVFDYPDGLARPIVKSRLLVDDTIVAENDQPPFDSFTWDISTYLANGSHKLRVELEDHLGLVGSSSEILVDVNILPPEINWTSVIKQNLPVVSGLAGLLTGAVVFLVLILSGWLKPRQPCKEGPKKSLKKRLAGSLVQTLAIPADIARNQTSWISRLQKSYRPSTGKILAYLTPIENDYSAMIKLNHQKDARSRRFSHSNVLTPIPIRTEELTVGSDPEQALLMLTDPSVENLHARLCLQPDQKFMVFDNETTAGTWVNYSQISAEGQRINQGDIIHFGRAGFRFTLERPLKYKNRTKRANTGENSPGESATIAPDRQDTPSDHQVQP